MASSFYTLHPGDRALHRHAGRREPDRARRSHRRDDRADRHDGASPRRADDGRGRVGDERRRDGGRLGQDTTHGWRAARRSSPSPTLTPERKEFYDRLDAEHGAAVGSARRDHSAGAPTRNRAGAVALRRSASAADGSRPPAHARRKPSGACSILENPGLRGQSTRHGQPLHRPAADPARRDRAAVIVTRRRRCASCSRAPAPTPPSKASARRCTRATSS